MSQTVGLLHRMRNDYFLVFKLHHDWNRRISEDDVQLLDAVLDDNRPNKSLESGLLTRVKNKWALQKEKKKKKLHVNYGAFPRNLQSPPGVFMRQRHTFFKSSVRPGSGFHAVHDRSRALVLLLRAKYKQRKEVDFNRPLRRDLVFIKVQTWADGRALYCFPAPGPGPLSRRRARGFDMICLAAKCNRARAFQGREANRKRPDWMRLRVTWPLSTYFDVINRQHWLTCLVRMPRIQTRHCEVEVTSKVQKLVLETPPTLWSSVDANAHVHFAGWDASRVFSQTTLDPPLAGSRRGPIQRVIESFE